jgi:hypothetical protein
MDEPLSNLDAKLRVSMRASLNQQPMIKASAVMRLPSRPNGPSGADPSTPGPPP